MKSLLLTTLLLCAAPAWTQDYREYPNGVAIGLETLEALINSGQSQAVRITVEANPRTNIYTTVGGFVPIVYGYGADAAAARAACIEVARRESERTGSTVLAPLDPSEWCWRYGIVNREAFPDYPCLGGRIFAANPTQEALGWGKLHREGSYGWDPTSASEEGDRDRTSIEDYLDYGELDSIIVTFCWAGHD